LIPGFPFTTAAESATPRIGRIGQRGQGLVEYALIIVLIAIGFAIAITAFRTQLQTVFDTIVNKLSTAS
jgi:Flp pilus assembly pilin Flp